MPGEPKMPTGLPKEEKKPEEKIENNTETVSEICEAWGILLFKKGAEYYLINLGTSSLDLSSGAFGDEKGDFDLEKYLKSSPNEFVEIKKEDFDEVVREIEKVNEDRYAEWPTVKKYLHL